MLFVLYWHLKTLISKACRDHLTLWSQNQIYMITSETVLFSCAGKTNATNIGQRLRQEEVTMSRKDDTTADNSYNSHMFYGLCRDSNLSNQKIVYVWDTNYVGASEA